MLYSKFKEISLGFLESLSEVVTAVNSVLELEILVIESLEEFSKEPTKSFLNDIRIL